MTNSRRVFLLANQTIPDSIDDGNEENHQGTSQKGVSKIITKNQEVVTVQLESEVSGAIHQGRQHISCCRLQIFSELELKKILFDKMEAKQLYQQREALQKLSCLLIAPCTQVFETGVQDEQAEEEVPHLPDWNSPQAHNKKMDWINPEGRQYPHDLRQPLPDQLVMSIQKDEIIAVTKVEIVEWHDYKHLDWITVRRDDDVLYKFKEGDLQQTKDPSIEVMLFLSCKEKVTNSQR
ncbi:hypothetical protein Tco_0724236 [Tanacetum coccineum]